MNKTLPFHAAATPCRLCDATCPSIAQCSDINTITEVDLAVSRYARHRKSGAWPDFNRLVPASVRHLFERAA
jgi:hypothetical protein